MQANDKLPFKSASAAVNSLFHFNMKHTYYVKSGCFLVDGHILNIGQKYFIRQKSGDRISEIVLLYCFYYGDNFNLIVQEIGSKYLSIISHCLKSSDCTWVLMDLDHFKDLLAIEDYCGCSENSKDDELLEFDF